MSIEVIETDSYDESFVALQAVRPIAQYEQITLRYGTGFETSLEMLDKYGFYAESNPNDARIDWDLVEHERLQPLSTEVSSEPSLVVVHRFSQHLHGLWQNRLQ